MFRFAKQKNHGVVLFIVLIFFQLITMLGLYILQTSYLFKKMNTAYWQHYVLILNANDRLQSIESSSLARCNIEVTTRIDLLSKSFNWWQLHGCGEVINEISYYYVIEPLNTSTCISLNNDDLWVPVKNFRITLLTYSKNKVFREILQSVVIKLDNARRDCVGDYSDAHIGRQSLRRL